MNSKSKFSDNRFNKISIDGFLDQFKKNNKNTDLSSLKKDLLYFKGLNEKEAQCSCGNAIWIIGSAIVGKGCFTCITGEADTSNDYEIG